MMMMIMTNKQHTAASVLAEPNSSGHPIHDNHMPANCLGKDTVSKEHQDDEVGAEEHATVVNTTV